MKVIIAGSRNCSDQQFVNSCIQEAIAKGFNITEVVCGGAKGVDTMGENWARSQRLPVAMFPALWDIHGKKAGILRNLDMACYAEALIAIWDGESPGTKHMINTMRSQGKQVLVFKWVPPVPEDTGTINLLSII